MIKENIIEFPQIAIKRKLLIPATMLASVIESPQKIVLREALIPKIGNEDVLVKIKGSGLCASNLPVWEGREWFKYPLEPGSPGHEGYGTVAAIGSMVTNFNIGDKVAFLSGHAYAEYDKAHESQVVKIPFNIDEIPFPAEPLGCAVNVFNRSNISIGQTVVVIGTGFLGCLLIQLIRNAGAKVIAVSRRTSSLDFASTAGANNLVPLEDVYNTIKQINSIESGGIPIVIEACGTQSAIDIATEIISIRGRIVVAGYHQDGLRTVNFQKWNWKGIDIINAHERDEKVYIKGIKEAIRLTEEGILQPQKFITNIFSLKQINTAFKFLKERPEGFQKAVIIN